ncbi:2-amino-4-hydroxy-6-hydroxymethyldihydropteridine diphosphokinase [Candidatus Peregrinibacteria bacterium]|jgi:2-amino-4-hydroxy-6-hydroxymethyldihydropteridine diphosphokinase|nr:2-amino-4-hydroxy-6-hydroxymethyldihydropteridine diphosphokinase [Candidatus Peregrinibacteria bacterium]MBT7736115.1 2-amino-4-hydroxy-6-hydroxymethyldihydropteridine diphosphokinase [Candidatus Peregrinibacteria bacterium]
MKENKTIHIALGSNLQDRKKNLQTAIKEIANFADISKKSSIYETEPVGYKDQGKFLNQVIEIKADISPTDLIIRLQEIEHKMGRTREITNGPRTIDLDILFYENEVVETDSLTIPHPRMHERAFVLEPLNEIAQDKNHPTLNKTINTLWTSLK